MHLKGKDWRRFRVKISGSKSSRMTKLGQFWQGHPKPVFSKKVQSGDQEKFFKNRPKSSPRLKGSKALCRKRHYALISIHLKCNYRKRFRRKQRLQKCKNGLVKAIVARSPKTRIFWKSSKGRPRENFKNHPRNSLRLKGPKALWRKWHYRVTSMHLKCKDWRRF